MESQTQPAADRAFFGHPKGLGLLAATEGWVGFSYYGMQSLLVLYMVGQLLQPGHIERVLGFGPVRAFLEGMYGPLAGQPLASAITAAYAALIYATPILGGIAADRWLGRRLTVTIGCVLMTLGHFLMVFDATFLVALLCLVIGAGCAGTLRAQVGDLYARGDLRRADAFQLYMIVFTAAVIFAPLVCGTLGEKVAWHYGFGAAGIGMLIGLIGYLWFGRWLPSEPPLARRGGEPEPPLTAQEWRVAGVLVLLLPVIALASIGNMEIFNAYLLWGKANYQLVFFGQVMPITWLLSLDAFIGVGATTANVLFWRWWSKRRRNPDEIVKVGLGAIVAASAPLILSLASLYAAGGHKVGLGWGLAFHIVNNIAFANVYIIGLALYSRAAPKRIGATMVNAFSLTIFLANVMVGKLAGLLATMSGAAFWALHAALILSAAAILLACARLFRRTLAPENAPGSA
jgi:POT family proton-dependent oligopeptide transporter